MKNAPPKQSFMNETYKCETDLNKGKETKENGQTSRHIQFYIKQDIPASFCCAASQKAGDFLRYSINFF